MSLPQAPEAGFDADWLVPQWPVPPRVRAVCTTRAGGVSQGAYAALNLGDHVGDADAAVQANRARLAQGIGARPVFLRQVHGRECLTLGVDMPDGAVADACSTQDAGLACTIMVADCLPVLLCDLGGTRVAAAHAGWRGLAGGVLEATRRAFPQSPVETVAWLGPCIGPRAFEVGPEVKAAFEAQDAGAAACFVPGRIGKWLADLPALARRRLRSAGVARVFGNDGSDAWCTVRNPSRFFSHRGGAGVSGRMAACVWLT